MDLARRRHHLAARVAGGAGDQCGCWRSTVSFADALRSSLLLLSSSSSPRRRGCGHPLLRRRVGRREANGLDHERRWHPGRLPALHRSGGWWPSGRGPLRPCEGKERQRVQSIADGGADDWRRLGAGVLLLDFHGSAETGRARPAASDVGGRLRRGDGRGSRPLGGGRQRSSCSGRWPERPWVAMRLGPPRVTSPTARAGDAFLKAAWFRPQKMRDAETSELPRR